MSKQQRKKYKKTKGKDRILLSAKPNEATLRHLGMQQQSTSDKSKKIKKQGGFQKNIITDHSVRMKAKSHRLVVPTNRLK